VAQQTHTGTSSECGLLRAVERPEETPASEIMKENSADAHEKREGHSLFSSQSGKHCTEQIPVGIARALALLR